MNPEVSALLDEAWGVIANAHSGRWSDARDEWRQAAERWRDKWLIAIAADLDRQDAELK